MTCCFSLRRALLLPSLLPGLWRGLLLILWLAVAGRALAAAPCGDDARLARLPEFLEAGGAVEPPLTITPETFLRLAPEAAVRLATSLRVCPDIPVNAQGKTLVPLEVDFHLLLEQVNICANAEDWACLERLRRQFKARPLPAAAIPSLLMQPRGDVAFKKQLGKILGVPLRQHNTMLYTDFFQALGGRVIGTGEAIVIGAHMEDATQVHQLRNLVATSFPQILLVSMTGGRQPVVESLRALGFSVLHVEYASDASALRQQLLARQ